MNAFDYVSVLISIVLALGMTRVLAGVGEMLQAMPDFASQRPLSRLNSCFAKEVQHSLRAEINVH
jgi:hypothetical protein